MFGKLNKNPLYANRANGVEFGSPTEATTDWLQKIGITSSTCRQKLNAIFESSPYFKELNALDQRKVFSTGQYALEGKDESGEYWLLFVPNGVLRIERSYGYRPVWFKNEDYSPLLEKPIEPEECINDSCERGWIYNMGTAYPCSMCTAHADYRIALKAWNTQQAS